MNILVYTSYYLPYISGITVYMERILANLAQKNSVTVLTFRYQDKLPKKENKNNVHITRMPYLFRISKGFISFSSIITFLTTVPKSDTVIVTLPNVEALFLVLYARLCRKKVISIFQCEIDLGPGIFRKSLSYAVSIVGFIELLFSHHVIGFNEYTQSLWFYPYISHKFLPSLPPIEQLAVDTQIYKQLQKKKGAEIWIGFVGRISREKGIEYLITALAQLRRSKPNISVVFIGPSGKQVAGEEAYYADIERLVKESNINAINLGIVEQHTLGAAYKSLDVLVTPSINKTEAFGMTQAEAMLVGTPVVSSNLPGVRQSILQTGMGELVRPANSNDIEKALEKILENRAQYTSKEKVQQARQIFNIRSVYMFYNDIISR